MIPTPLLLNDRTRDEKIKSLEDAQTKYKSESVLLDQQNNEMRKKLRSLTVTMQSAGRALVDYLPSLLFRFRINKLVLNFRNDVIYFKYHVYSNAEIRNACYHPELHW